MVPIRLASQQEELTTCTAPRKLATALSTTLLITSDEEQSFIEQKCGYGNPPAILPCHLAPLGPSPLMEPELGLLLLFPSCGLICWQSKTGAKVPPPCDTTLVSSQLVFRSGNGWMFYNHAVQHPSRPTLYQDRVFLPGLEDLDRLGLGRLLGLPRSTWMTRVPHICCCPRHQDFFPGCCPGRSAVCAA